ncbi:MAG: leucine-rich repeat protein, partial [Clostridia bacterium]|nr:leucine-rich repeat protein [Clostridia bacterium]
VFVEATCSKRAHTEYTCTLCGHSYSIYEGEYGEHVPITIYEKGNCISYGCTKQKCSVCGIILSREFDTEFGEHDYEIKNEYYAGDCKTRGYTVVKRCKTCKKEIIEQGSYGGHRLGKTVHVDPTCVSEGYDEATCTVCGEYKERFNVVQPSEHNFKETTIPGSDCEHLTVIESRCLDCGYTVTNETDLYGPHNYVKTSSSSEHACSVCGTSAPHNVVVKDVSDTRHLSYCDVCGYQHASGTGEHCYVLSVVRDASCTGNVSIIYTCDVCGHIQSALLPMRHDYSVTSVDVATCAENGRVTLACGECGKTATESYYYAADSASVGVAPAIKLLSTAAVERSGDYVYFGSYPYSRITYPIHIDALNALAGEKPTPENAAAWTVASYCSGAAYSWYVDVTYCGEKYRGLYFTAYRPASLSAEPTADNSYVDENGYSTGVVYWFRYEKLRWSVLSSQDELLLFSCDILDAQALGASSSTWEESALRAYLNETFASVAFSAEEKAMFSGTPNVFLLTAEDIVSTAYGFTSGDTFSAPRALIASAYAWAQGLRMENYWLSPASAAEEYAVVAYGYAMDRATGHDFRETIASGSLRTAATCIAYATYYKTCSVCGALSSEYFADEEDGYALHDYEYTYTELTHRYACKACGEELLQEEHVLSYEDDLNGISHTESCSVCGYVFRKDHTFAGDNCSLCNAEKYSYDARWDVSGGENSVVAYMNGTTLTIRGKGNMVDFSAQTPAPYASYRQSICVVKIDPQVTSIGAYAFYGFSSLATITVPEQIEKIGKYAFAYAESVSYLEFNARTCGSFVVNNYVFANLGRKSAELNVTIGSAVENISAYLLCPSEDTLPRVTSLTISGASVTNIGDYAFYGISLPVNVTLPTVRSIGKYAFYNNVAAKSFILGGELSSVGDYAFYRCQDATIRVGSFLTNVGEYAFYDSHGLSSVLLGVNAVPDYAFYNTGLDLLTFSVAPTSIGNYAFFGAPLTTVLKENSSIKDFLSAATSIGDYAFYQSEINGDLSSRDLVSVGEKAFYGCRNILRVSVCALASVGKYAFAECSGLSVFDADALTSVPEGCFAGDSDLEYVFLSSSLTDVGKEAFLSCYRLTSFMLPATLSSIGVNAFKGCFTLVELDNRSSFTLKEGAVSNGYVAMYAKHIYNGAAGESSRLQTQNSLRLLQMDETWIVGYSGHFIDANLTLENNVVAYAFYKASGVKNVTVRSNVVEKYAFYEAEEINNVYLEEGCRVEENAFASCENLRSVYLETDPASVDVTAFNGDVINLLSFSLSSLTSLTESPLFTAINAQKLKMELNTEETVPEIEGYTGEKRNDYVNYTRVAAPITITGAVTPTITYTLTKIHPNGYDLSIDGIGAIPDYTANTVPWAEYIDKITKVTFSVGITRVGDYAFRGASSLFRINWEQGVTSVGDYAFCDCSALTAVHFPDDLMTIGNHAFENCSFLGDIFFNSLLSAIGEYAFAGCEETYSVQLYQGMTNVGAHAFENCKNVRYLYLPASVTTIGEYAFAGCINMQSIQFDCVNCADLARNNYVFYNCGQQGNGITLIIGDEVASIPAYLFNPVFDLKYPSPRITAITIPHELTVGDYAFRNVTSASTIDLSCASSIGSGVLSGTAPTSLVLSGLAGTLGYFFDGSNASVPVGLTSIRLTASANVPDDAFAGCSHIAFVTLPDVTTAVTIGARAFKDCSSLSDFSISCNGVTVGEDAFFGCSSLQYVFYAGTEAQWQDIYIGISNTPLQNAYIHYGSTGHTPGEPV